MATSAVAAAPLVGTRGRVLGEIGAALRRPLVAACVLLVIYFTAMRFCDADGSIGSDTGARVATLRAMGDHRLHPDVGYWAEGFDPEGRLHPLSPGAKVGERWVVVGTIVTPLVAQPLYRLGGYQAVLLIPTAGVVATAFAARRLARRLEPTSGGWLAFWLVALASPLVVYGLDFWDHAHGLALMAWGIVWLLEIGDVVGSRAAVVRRSLGAGLVLGVAATMRTETFVYAAAATMVVGMGLLLGRSIELTWRRRLAVTALAGVCFVVPFGALQALNGRIEQAALGAELRSSRAVEAASGVDQLGLDDRIDLAFLSSVGLRASVRSDAWTEAGLVVVASAAAALALARRRRAIAIGCTVIGGAALVARLRLGLHYVPGMIAVAPFVPAGLVMASRLRRPGAMLAIAGMGFVGVIATQWAEVNPTGYQWGGRYVLLSGLLLSVVGITGVARLGRVATVVALASALAVAGLGFELLRVRSNISGDLARGLEARTEVVLIDRSGWVFRGVGAAYDVDRRWLTGRSDPETLEAFAIADTIGAPSVGLIETEVARLGVDVPGWCAGPVDTVAWESGEPLTITTWTRSGVASACP